MAGRIDNSFGTTQIQQFLQNVDTTQLNGLKPNVNIGELLGTNPGTQVSDKKANLVSKEQYEYNGVKGLLAKYDDGSVIFQAKKQVNGKDVVFQYRFKNEKDFENKRPSSEILNPGNKQNQVTMNYTYHRNGRIKNKETRNAQNNIIKQEEFNNKGKVETRKLYDKDGNLTKDFSFKYNKDNSVDSTCKDKDGNVLFNAHTQYKPDGKTPISSEQRYPSGELMSESKYDDNGKIQSKVEHYEDGKIKSETEFYDNGVIKEQKIYDEQGNVTKKITSEIDGNFENSAQVSEGDCYLMATINGIRQTEGGQELLKDLVKVTTNANGEKVYTVTFPGAKVAAEGLRTDDRVDPNKMHITGEYTFTESEMQEILKQAGKKYSLGDGDMILLEAAFEKYRHEVAQTLDDNPKLKTEAGVAGTQTGRDRDNILAGGYSEDPTFIITGRTSSVYSIYKDNPPYGLSYEDLQAGTATVVSTKPNNNGLVALQKGAVSEVDGDISKSKEDLNKMLDTIMNDANDGHIDNIAVASFKMVHADGSPGGHALTIKSVTADTVTMVNPWHPDKEVTMSREDFIKSVGHVTVSDTTKPQATADDNTKPTGVTNPDPTTETKPPYVVKKGDNLWKIAKNILGPGAKNSEIADLVQKIIKANPQIKNPNLIYVNQKINLP